MNILVTKELESIFAMILLEDKSENEWAEIESDDMFQSKHFCGGFDATERAFCFSYYDDDGIEYWFQLSLSEILVIVEQGSGVIKARPAG
ncbi:MAG TPA: hypothetical protein PLN05_16810 [Pyrinomonadaceae bacterium]|nr:hypothetical protein [Chloracidobacterium sp.]HRJ90468.1 hypothetical protein [Pyrinomonadaceae bacterium]HRK52083.1 hypothetical protein [Pyrinomonadaceae bacterium]